MTGAKEKPSWAGAVGTKPLSLTLTRAALGETRAALPYPLRISLEG